MDQAVTRVREVYERAVANVPMANEKRLWRRYIFLWLYYAVFEETETKVRRVCVFFLAKGGYLVDPLLINF